MKFQLKNKTKNRLYILAVTLSIIASILVIGGHFNLFSIPPSMPIDRTDVSLVSDNGNSATYSFYAKFNNYIPRSSACSSSYENYATINFEIVGDSPYTMNAMPQFIDNLIENEYFKADSPNTDVSALNGEFPCIDIQLNQNYSNTYCKIYNQGPYNQVNRAIVTCKFNSQFLAYDNGLNVPAGFYGFSYISTQVTIPKIGFCQPGLTKCSDGNCRNSCDTNITIFRFENNECNQIEILSSERTTNDYNTLEECKLNITSYISIIIIILVIVGLVMGLSYLYFKTRRKH